MFELPEGTGHFNYQQRGMSREAVGLSQDGWVGLDQWPVNGFPLFCKNIPSEWFGETYMNEHDNTTSLPSIIGDTP